MKRRMYFLFPDTDTAKTAVKDLIGLDVAPANIHTIARADIDLAGLPVATDPQRHDALAQLETGMWNGNLAVFALAALGLVLALVYGQVWLAIVAAAIMIATVAGGAWFAMRVPHTHLDEFRQAIQHGEILLLVDVSRDCVEEIETLMERRHPEAVIGGNSWTPGVAGI
jgi:hypothetical protein